MTATLVLRANTYIIFLKYLWQILKIAARVNLFVSIGETRLNVSSLLERGLSMHFPPKIRQILPPCDNCDIKKRAKGSEEIWSTLADSDSAIPGMYINCCFFCLSVRPRNFVSLPLFLFLLSPEED